MGLKHSLRVRVTGAFLALGAAICILSAAGMHFWVDDMEMRFIDATMGEQLDYIIEQTKRDPTTPPPSTATMHGYVTTPGDDDELPSFLRGLGSGAYERDFEEHEYHIMVRDSGMRRYYLSYDATRLEPFEALFHGVLVFGAFGFTLLSLWSGYWLSGRVIAPVTRLAEAVKRANVDSASSLAFTDYGNDEVGELALTFEHYTKRVSAYAQREAAFTAEISHELRNYLFVIGSSVELLAVEMGSDGQSFARIDRLQRAIQEMRELLDVILILAREPETIDAAPSDSANVETVLREVLSTRQSELTRKKIGLRVEVAGNAELRAPAPVLRAVLCKLLDSAIADIIDGEITVSLDENGVTVIETGARSPDVSPSNSDIDQGMSHSIVARLCERYDWRIESSAPNGRVLQARLLFGH
jgi:signal transduction histidine kinase